MHTKTAISILSLLAPIHATTTVRVWTHFYPSCPGDPSTDLGAYEHYEQAGAPRDITIGGCENIAVPSYLYERNLVNHVSLDAELVSHHHYGESGDVEINPDCGCKVTLHEVPGCIDPPLVSTPLEHRAAVSTCAARQLSYSEVWAKLTCDKTHDVVIHENEGDNKDDVALRKDKLSETEQAARAQTPGSDSESWHRAQTAQSSERAPEEEARVNSAGHVEADSVFNALLEYLKHKNATSILHNNATQHLNLTQHINGTANNTISRRHLSVLRNRLRLY
ncbi:uncharacterized protein PFLUO_LOCUS5926 [Penicillium psychrofluorescens]|uniref:uncharacterized protein n=1 Tax=Penicillium psychrofluorescens TaxID=3158075 RepID=UPI003CCD29A5